MNINRVTLQDLADIIESASVAETVDFGSAVLNKCSNAVMGDFVTLSLPDGTCAIIQP